MVVLISTHALQFHALQIACVTASCALPAVPTMCSSSCAGEDDDMPLAAAAATKKMPSDKQLVMSVEEILAGEDVQSFALSALMKRLRERRAVAVPALLLARKRCIE